MTASTLLSATSADLKPRKFERRSLLPIEPNYLWRIESGVVRTLTYNPDGTLITFGLWGVGDIAGKVLSKADPYQIECLTPVEATLLPVSRGYEVSEAIFQHVQQHQEFIEILHCRSVDTSLMQLLIWLAKKFGKASEQGQLIDLQLTHQDLASVIRATRVTVTRLLNEFEQRGIIQRLPHRFIVMPNQQPFWHYEI